MSVMLIEPWPWYIAGPLLGLFPPLLLLVGNKLFGMSSNLRHLCAALCPRDIAHFHYEWRREGAWNLVFALGIVIGGFVAGYIFANPDPVAIAASTRADLATLGITDFTGLLPAQLFALPVLLEARVFSLLALGGLLVGFGTAYAGGCTSGHGLSGVADLQPASLLALLSFFAGGIAGTFFLLPVLL